MAQVDQSFETISAEHAADRLRPIVTLAPISGFPENIQSIDNPEVTLDLADRLQSFVFTSHEKKIASCELTFLDEDGLFTNPNQLAHGAVIDVAWGYPGLMSEKYRLIVRKLKLGLLQGRRFARRRRGFLVTFTALAPGILMHDKAPDADDIYENVPLSTVVKIIGQKLGFHSENRGDKRLLIQIPANADQVRPVITRAATEDYFQFLKRLANEVGLLCQQDKDGLYFGERRTDNKAIIELVIDQNADQVMGFELEGDLIFGVPADIVAIGVKPASKKFFKVSALEKESGKKQSGQEMAHTGADTANANSVDTPAVEVTGVVSVEAKGVSKAQAINKTRTVMVDFKPSIGDKIDLKIAKHLNERIKKKWRLKVRIVGNANALAGRNIEMKNFDTELVEGIWYVLEARHVVDHGGFTTELTCRREEPKKASTTPIMYRKAETLDKEGKAALKKGDAPETVEGLVTIIDTQGVGEQKTKKKSHDTSGQFFPTRKTRDR